MKHLTLTQSNYSNNYNALQLSLPIDLGIKIDPNDEVVSFQEAIEGVNLGKYIKKEERRGRKGHDKVMLLKVILFANMENIRDPRSMAKACKNDIRYLWLSKETQPSHMAFERLIKNYLIKSIDDIYFDVLLKLVGLMEIDLRKVYIDGTKIEANANKYTFVYKARILNAREKLYHKITDILFSLNFKYGYNYRINKCYSAQEIGYVAQYLMEVISKNKIKVVYGKGQKKTEIQRYYDTILEYYIKLSEYEYWLSIIGEERNSCSKTDHDATMCATKMDYYCNTGLSRPCYNAQIAVADGLIVNADLFQRPGDTQTFIPFMERHVKYLGEYPKYPVADAGYGSYDNYMYCLVHGMEMTMKYNYYAKKNEAKFRNNIYNVMNWEKDEHGNKICPEQHVFNQLKSEKYDESGKYLRITKQYTSKESCENCPHREKCYSGKGDRKIVSRNDILDEFYAKVDENLSTEEGKELKKQRSIQVEGAFGVIKQNMKFTRFTRRGLENAKMEFLLVCLGYNLKKYHHYRLTKKNEVIN